jgi:gamma-glutamyltranspeptidase / glutathione hydrolase
MGFRSFIIATLVTCFVASLSWAQDNTDLPSAITTKREMVVTANPLATEAGEHILKIGGTAADAMIAVQTVLGLVEPQSSGLGGGAFVVYYDAATGHTITIDAREKAPSSATENLFLDANDDSLGFSDAWQSGLSVGVPGVPKMMEYMHNRYGKLPWQRLFVPAKMLAQKGFELTERTRSQVDELLGRNAAPFDSTDLNDCLEKNKLFFRDPASFDYFVNADDCTAKPAGTRMQNKAYANTLKAIAQSGAGAFYHGDIAEDIVRVVQRDLNRPGGMTVADLANYRVVERNPVCLDYRGHNVCGMGPPSSGGLAVGQILGILENFDLTGLKILDAKTVHLFAQAGRLAFADRNKYVADPDFITVPVEGMLNKKYLASRAALITGMDMGRALPGTPPGKFDPAGPDTTAKLSGTTHVSIVDCYGNALSMTSSIESSFGNGVMVRGFLLNNELTDFSFQYEDSKGVLLANRVQPNKRPRSSMSPTIVFGSDGKPELVTGSPGGSRIIGYTAQSIMNVFDFGLDPQQAINVPHFMNRNGTTDLEKPIPGVTLDYDPNALDRVLIDDFGYNAIDIIAQTSGLSIIQVIESKNSKTSLVGGADKRRDGTVGGQ